MLIRTRSISKNSRNNAIRRALMSREKNLCEAHVVEYNTEILLLGFIRWLNGN